MNNLFHKTWDDLQMSERSELYLLYVGKEVMMIQLLNVDSVEYCNCF